MISTKTILEAAAVVKAAPMLMTQASSEPLGSEKVRMPARPVAAVAGWVPGSRVKPPKAAARGGAASAW